MSEIKHDLDHEVYIDPKDHKEHTNHGMHEYSEADLKDPIDYPKSKPVITELPKISFRSDQVFSLPLNKVIIDKDTQLDQITWEISGNKKVKVNIESGKQISFSAFSEDFEGTELITLMATDPEKQSDKKSVIVTVVLSHYNGHIYGRL